MVKVLSSHADAQPSGENPATLSWPSPRPTKLADALFLARLIRRHRPDCLIANFATVNWMCLIGWLYGVRHRIAFYHTLSAPIEMDNGHLHGGGWEIRRFRKKLVYKTATAIAGISQAALNDARKSFCVPLRKCQPWRYSMPDPASSIRLRSSEEREDLIICAGRLHPSKGQDVLIRALALGGCSLASIRVEFLGGGRLLDTLRQMAEQNGMASRCSFAGSVSHKEVLARMSRAKITVVPSRHEAFGLVNIESMAVGTPVVASQVDGIAETIRDGVDGWLVPPDNPNALAEKLVVTLQDGALRKRLGQNARQHFLERFEHALALKKQADWLEQIVQPDSRGAFDES